MTRVLPCMVTANGLILALAVSSALARSEAAAPAFDDLERSFEVAVESFLVEFRAADEAERDAMMADPEREPRQRFTPLFLAAAQRSSGTEGALRGWTWLAEHGAIADSGVGELAIERLLTDHLWSPDLGPAAKAIRRSAGMRGHETAHADLTTIIEGSPHVEVRAEGHLQRGLLWRRSEDPERLTMARDDLEQARYLATDGEIVEKAMSALAGLGVLAVGTKAPDLTGTTLAGERVEALHLRGKVVLVEFWGMWCGPCVAKILELNRLQAGLGDRPFALIGVNSDEDPETVRKFLEQQKVDWPSIADGSTEGPVAEAWAVRSWPASYLVDQEGTIQARNPSKRELSELLARMLDSKRADRQAGGSDSD